MKQRNVKIRKKMTQVGKKYYIALHLMIHLLSTVGSILDTFLIEIQKNFRKDRQFL
jgi:hypothetical protein